MKIKPLLTGILIGAIALPTISLGGTFVASLIAGKTPAEAVEVLATQIDSLIGRVETIETKQSGFQSQLVKAEACREADNLLIEIKETCGFNSLGIDECIAKYFQKADKNKHLPNHVSVFLERANKLEELKPLYLSAKSKCEQ